MHLDDFPFDEIMEKVSGGSNKASVRSLLSEMIKLILSHRSIKSLKGEDAILMRKVLNMYAKLGCIYEITQDQWFMVASNGVGYNFNWMDGSGFNTIFVTITGIVDCHDCSPY